MVDRRYSIVEIQDRLAIEDLYDRQLAAAEAMDWETYDLTFSPRALVNLEDFGRPECTYPEYREWLIAIAPGMLQAQRVAGGLRLHLSGDSATTRVPVVCHVLMKRGSDERWTHTGLYYNDELRRTVDGWRIHRRREELCWER